ncbi:hypothetical protein QE152_g37728 [Popillia japonica]|uniref:Uncharacterized protein n=1 Tax=Popillia japonica TaxID=7064 RepID=A0AAW1I8S8_POPJA
MTRANTRQQSKCRKLGKQLTNPDSNTSYVTILETPSDENSMDNTDEISNIQTDLRNRLAKEEFDNQQLREKVVELNKHIEELNALIRLAKEEFDNQQLREKVVELNKHIEELNALIKLKNAKIASFTSRPNEGKRNYSHSLVQTENIDVHNIITTFCAK